MGDAQRKEDIENLARMAARLAGRDPDEPLKITLGELVVFEGPAWRYCDFMKLAEEAYCLLKAV